LDGEKLAKFGIYGNFFLRNLRFLMNEKNGIFGGKVLWRLIIKEQNAIMLLKVGHLMCSVMYKCCLRT